MSAIDPFREMVDQWNLQQAYASGLEAENARLKARIAELEGVVPAPAPPVEPPTGKLALVPFTEPPLLLNHGSWDKTDQRASHEVKDGVLTIHVAQGRQESQRVIRRDFGLQKPGALGGGFLREPAGKLRRYEIKVHIPEDYDPAGEMCNLWQWHTSSAKQPPYLSFMLWSKSSRWRHNHPDGGRIDHAVNPIKKGHVYALAVEALWSKKVDGVLRAWEDGEKVFEDRGPNYRAEEDEAPYLVLGMYFPSAIKAFSNTVSFSDFRMGDV